MADKKYIVDMFSEIVDNMRHTGTVLSFTETSGTYTIVSSNTMHEGWHVTIDSVNYKISNVTSSGFTITGATGLDFTSAAWKSLEPYYDYGHVLSILSKLQAKSGREDKFQRYPLIMLIQDIEEDHLNDLAVSYTLSPRVVILATTDKNYTEQERYTNVFKPILYPIWELLIDEIQNYQYFKFTGYVEFKKIDRVHWGTSSIFGNEASIFNDYLDGIELLFEPINITRNTGTLCL